MFGCANNRNGPNSCTIILIIVIFALQGLLNGSSQSRTALILLFLFWLCGSGGCGFGRDGFDGCGTNGCMPINNCNCMPMNNCCCMPMSKCCGRSRRRRKDRCTCDCKRVKVCFNPNRCCGE